MYYELFNDVFENKICIFEIGEFYVITNELLGLKKVCFAPGICKAGACK